MTFVSFNFGSYANTATYKFTPTYINKKTRSTLTLWSINAPAIQPYLLGEIDEGYEFIQPLQISIEIEDDSSFVISDDIFLVYGIGDNLEDAIEDYINSFKEYYNLVKKSAQNNEYDKKTFQYLQSYLVEKTQRGYNALQTDRD